MVTGVDDMFTVETEYSTVVQGVLAEDTSVAGPPQPHSPPPSPVVVGGGDDIQEEPAAPVVIRDEDLDDDHDDDVPLRIRSIDNILGPVQPQGLAQQGLAQELHVVSSDESGSFDEVERDLCWRRAMMEEMKSIEDNTPWFLTNLPLGRSAIGLKWVFKVKRDEQGNITKHKARLVVKGYTQRCGIDYDEVSAPVACLDSVRLLIALVGHEGWEVHHLDVKSAFLNGDLHEEVFVQQPIGFMKSGEEHKVLKLRKALYGLHQALRAWNAKLDDTLISLGFSRCPSEPAIYTRRSGQNQLVIGVYVDDLMIMGADSGDIKKFKPEMENVFRMSDLGLLRYYLGIEV
jgi:hypothetical protein